MSKVIQHSEMHHFADDTNLLYSSENHDLKLIVQWLRANRISLNVDKAEIIILLPKDKDIIKKT